MFEIEICLLVAVHPPGVSVLFAPRHLGFSFGLDWKTLHFNSLADYHCHLTREDVSGRNSTPFVPLLIIHSEMFNSHDRYPAANKRNLQRCCSGRSTNAIRRCFGPLRCTTCVSVWFVDENASLEDGKWGVTEECTYGVTFTQVTLDASATLQLNKWKRGGW